MRTGVVALLMISALLQGCSSFPIVQEGFHTKLPIPPAMSMVWGNDPIAVDAAMIWLQAHGFGTVERRKLQRLLAEQPRPLTGTWADAAQLVGLGRGIGAEQLVYVDMAVKPVVFSRPFLKDLGSKPPEKETLYYIQVSIHGVEVQTGEETWGGSAQMAFPVPEVEGNIIDLIGRALAGVLGADERHPPSVKSGG